MHEYAKKVLQALYNEYECIGYANYCNATTISGLPDNKANFGVNQLESLSYINKNVFGEVILTKYAISCF